MNWIETIALILITITIVMTLFTEPKLSFQYFKACSKSGIVLIKKGIEVGKNIIGSFVDSKEAGVNEAEGGG